MTETTVRGSIGIENDRRPDLFLFVAGEPVVYIGANKTDIDSLEMIHREAERFLENWSTCCGTF
jgi:hypothetical protein